MSDDSLPLKNGSRRTFLRAGTGAVLATAACPALGAARVLDRASATENASGQSASKMDFEFDEITIDDLQKGFASGQYSSRSVTEKYLARIQEIDQAGPMLNAMIEINPDAMQDCRRA